MQPNASGVSMIRSLPLTGDRLGNDTRRSRRPNERPLTATQLDERVALRLGCRLGLGLSDRGLGN